MGHIYIIYNIVNSKFYLGSTCEISVRFRDHLYELSTGRKDEINPYLQNAWNKYGKENFIFEVIEECPDEIVLKREQYYLDCLCPWDREIGYNIAKFACSAMKGRKHSQKTLGLMSEAQKNKIRTPEHCKNLSLSMLGKLKSEDTKKLISKNRKGKYIGAENNFYGIHNFGEKNPFAKLTDDNAEEIRIKYKSGDISQCELAKIYNVSQATINNILLYKTYNEKTND